MRGSPPFFGRGLDLVLCFNDILLLKNAGQAAEGDEEMMWVIRVIGWFLRCDGLTGRYQIQTRRGREINLSGLRGGFLIFSEKEA